MNEEIKASILNKIKEYDRIIISRHSRPDGDAIGSTLGLAEVLRESFPEKEIYVINSDYSDYLAFLGEEDEDVSVMDYTSALAIVIDTATFDRAANPKISIAKEIIKIDHHKDSEEYGSICLIEGERSSACELVADFCLGFDELIIDNYAALCLYAGMMTDSGRFRYSPSGESLRIAAALLDIGIDTESLYANLYLQEFDYLSSRSKIASNIKITQNGVAYLIITNDMKQQYSLSNEDASTLVSLMDSIKGSLIWLAFIQNENGTFRVRLRSRFVTVNKLAEKYSGGGHDRASGATVHTENEMKALLIDADSLLARYKAENDGWI